MPDSPYAVPPVADGQELLNSLRQQLMKGTTMTTDFSNLAAHARANGWTDTRERATSQAALDAAERYAELPHPTAPGGLTIEQIEQDAFTTGYDEGRDSRGADIATEIRLANLIAWVTREGHRPTKEQQQLINESLGL